MSSPGDEISVVLPTYNRAEAVRDNLGTLLALDDVAEVVVVVDGSTDATDEVLAQFSDPRLRIVRHPQNQGVSSARNSGIDASRGSWVLFAEDDCRFAADYATVLRAEARRLGADLVGVPLLYVEGTDEDALVVARKAARVDHPSPEETQVFPTEPFETPFIPARAIVRREVFQTTRFDEHFLVNAYREETDFFVRAARSGYRVIFSPATYCWQLHVWDGGTHQPRPLHYEYWAMRNNWRFLRRHGAWLSEHGYISTPSRAQVGFIGLHLHRVIRGVAHARLRRLLHRG